MNIGVNTWALVGAAAARLVLEAVWYSKALFGKQAGKAKRGKGRGAVVAYLVDIVGSLLMAFVLFHAIHSAGGMNLEHGLVVGFWSWLGFIAVVTVGSVTRGKEPLKLWLINNGFQLVSILVMALILGTWG